MPLAPERYLEQLRSDGAALAAAAAVDTSARVPGCPDWDVAALVGHTGVIHRWVAEILRTRAQERPSRRGFAAPEGGPAVLEWYRGGLDLLVGALEDAGPDADVWNWARPRQPSAFWFRRMAQETAVHRWDAQSATGTPAGVPQDLAVDGIAEMLESFLPLLSTAGPPPDLGGSLHVHATDTEGEWTVRPGPEHLEVEPGHGKGDAAVRGAASDLLLALWGRPVFDRLETFGDSSVVERWRERVRF
ncbi:MAG TPA: maleylpyruvate isomerase family mycothiol-dependent enzyme [Acidimicrobiales bacterium]|nr:maleylpyruvate isomerase family mycothiol-dependent enzyme [Acidimicrobiales bacterium]